ncbi:DUF4292 domain-containing protein [Aurantibacter crassamenti]|uniref:DUF4292 domain-containing protein n=1 Tax=Aurantibacter crassamenti TaxID=1837375 RepID=UPI00193A4B66|nr:DUF4292 domain-containing protein [Aurantibacter crassamenti]MBM1105297.1 DUF4292 domain-containing protein [Aurantibacter crassamenti]
MVIELKNRVVLFILLIIVSSCGTNKLATDGTLNSKMSAKNVIRQHYLNQLDFKTLAGKLKIDYSDGDGSQGLTVSLRIEKDKAIWISAPLGIVKAYITPNRVSFYNKLDNEYFDGDFSYLSNILGTELDFDKVQNLLLGQALFNLKAETYMVSVADENYQLKPKDVGTLFKTLFQIEPKNFKMSAQQISQPLRKRLLDINYKNYQKINKWILPNEIKIVAIEKDNRNVIDIAYRNIEFDQELRFPYKIPDGFKEIVLTKNDF